MLIRFWFGLIHMGRTSGIAEHPYDASVTLCWGWRGDVPPEAPCWRHVWRIAWDWLPIRFYRQLCPTIRLPPTESQMLSSAISGRGPDLIEVPDTRGINSAAWTGRTHKFIGFGRWPRNYLHHRATRRSLMHVYRNGSKERASPRFIMYIEPAKLVPSAECPEEWKNMDGTPKPFEIEFKFGRASVPDNLGKLLVSTGHAKASNIVRATGGALLGSLAATLRGNR